MSSRPAPFATALTLTLALLVVSVGCHSGDHPAAFQPQQIVFPYQWKGVLLEDDDLREPSGICWHRERQSLFAVGDEGDVAELTTEGELLRSRSVLPGADFEGITVDPATGLLYVAIEGEERIVELDVDDLTVRRSFALDRTFEGVVRLKEGGQGIEAITFMPDPAHPEGGVFVVANQAFSLDDPNDTSALLFVELPLRTGRGDELTGRTTRYVPIPVIDLAGLFHDAATDHLYAVSDSDNLLLQLTAGGRILRAWAFPGDNQEGITPADDGHLYIAQDTGGILKVEWKR